LSDIVARLVDWLPDTALAGIILDHRWAWPICEALHFSGLVMIFGAVSFVDLRVLGLGRSISFAGAHRFIVIAFAGIVISAMTGLMFISGTPDQYFYNSAFHWKLFFFGILILNLGWFYRKEFAALRALEAGEDARLSAKVSAAISLCALLGVMSAGRMLTFFRPAFFN
jgi:hypothetical protein